MILDAILLAAGEGQRFGGVRKQFLNFNGQPLYERAMRYARRCGADHLYLVVPERTPIGYPSGLTPFTTVVTGGATRGDSIREGLRAIAERRDGTEGFDGLVMIHDVVRPLASERLVTEALLALRNEAVDAVIPTIPIDDTLADLHKQNWARSMFKRLQTPEVGRRRKLTDAFRTIPHVDAVGETDLRWVEIPGEFRNLKITRPEDLITAELLDGHLVGQPSLIPGSLSRKHYALIGASGTIGSAVRRELCSRGASVDPVTRADWDLNTPRIPEDVKERLHRADGVVYAAGIFGTTTFGEMLRVNLASVGAILATAWRDQPVVVLGSSAALHGRANQTPYAATKAAVHNLVQGFAANGWTANVVAPCRIESILRERHGLSTDAAVALEKVARVVADWVAHPTATGQIIHVRPDHV